MPLFSPEMVLSYPKIFRPELPRNATPNDKSAWSTTGLLTQAAISTDEFKAMQAAVIAAAKEKFGPEVSGKIEFDGKGDSFMLAGKQGALRMPFRRNVGKYADEFVLFVNFRKVHNPAKTVYPPQVVGRNGKPLTNEDEIYPGVRARVSMSCFAYSNNGNKGVSFGLNNVQKLGDGPRLDTFKSAEEEFGALPEEAPGAMPDMASLLG